MPVGKRKRVAIDAAEEKRIVKALENWAETEDFVGLRTRAFIYLLWDGSVKTKAALSLNAQEVVSDPGVLRVVKEIVQQPCEGNRYRQLRFFISDRTRRALTDYLRVVRRDGWLPSERFEGPLFLSSYHHGTGKRLSKRTAIHSFKILLQERAGISQDYQLDDVVYTGRLAFLKASGGDSSLLSQHAAISNTWASSGYREGDSSKGSPKDVMARLDKSR